MECAADNLSYFKSLSLIPSGQLPLYLLTHLFHKEAMLVTVAVQLIHCEDLERRQRAGTHAVTKHLDRLWTEYEADERTAISLLGAGCRLICPRVSMGVIWWSELPSTNTRYYVICVALVLHRSDLVKV